jgi:hypothetical protein
MTFRIDTSDLDDIAHQLGPAVKDGVAGVNRDAIGGLADAVLHGIRGAFARHRKTGATERRMRVTRHGDTADLELGSVPAVIIQTGQRPHVIRPTRARALELAGAGPGRSFAAVVHHPGVKPDPYVTRGLAAATGEMQTVADNAAAALAADVARKLGG